MATNEQIQSFAKKWIEIYNNKNAVSSLASDDLSTECKTLGFEMDCGKSLEAAFPGMENALWNGKLYLASEIAEDYALEKEIRKASGRKELAVLTLIVTIRLCDIAMVK